MMKKLTILGLCLAAWICLTTFVIAPGIYETDSIYGSQEIFLTQEEFDTFKQDFKNRVYQDDLKLGAFDVLASEPPIIVNFQVTVPYDYEFPYGESSSRELLFVPFIFICLFTFILGVVLPVALTFKWE